MSQHQNTSKTRTQAIGESKVDDSVFTAKGNGRFGTVVSEWAKARSHTSGENYGKGVLHANLHMVRCVHIRVVQELRHVVTTRFYRACTGHV